MRRNIIKEALGGAPIVLSDLAGIVSSIHSTVYDMCHDIYRMARKKYGIGRSRIPGRPTFGPDVPVEISEAFESGLSLLKKLEPIHDYLSKGKPVDPEYVSAEIMSDVQNLYELFENIMLSEPDLDFGPRLSMLQSASFVLAKLSSDIEERVGGAQPSIKDIPGSAFRSIDLARVVLLTELEISLDQNSDLSREERRQIRDAIVFLDMLDSKMQDITYANVGFQDVAPGIEIPFALREMHALKSGINRIPDSASDRIPKYKKDLIDKIDAMIKRYTPRVSITAKQAPVEDDFINENTLYHRFTQRMFRD